MLFLKWGLVILLIYMTGLLVTGTNFLFVDSFNLVMHEAGHLILMVFGPIISVMGGTLFQLLVPIICGGVLVIQQKDWFGGGVCLWWLGENLVNIGRYLADAPYQRLPLIGGEHDWAYLFGRWTMMDQAEVVGQFTKGLGIVVMISAIVWLVYQLLTIPKPTNDE